MPQEGRGRREVAVRGAVLPAIHLQSERVNSLLIDIPAPLVVVNKGNAGSQGDFAPFLDPHEFSESLCDVALFEDTEGLPEDEDWVLALAEFLVAKVAD